MGRRIYRELGPVRARLMAFGLIRATAWGLLAGALVGLSLGAWRWWARAPMSSGLWIPTLAAGPVLGLVVGLVRRRTWEAAAHAVDTHYDLKDRAATALAFLALPEPSPWHELQVADAAEHLSGVEARKVVPFRFPKLLPIASLVTAAAIGVFFIPIAPKKVTAAPSPPREATVAMAKSAEERLKSLDELAKEEKDEKLDALMKELKLKIAELMQPGVDQKEELAKLSDMQAAIAAQQAQMNVGLVDGQLASLGEALSSADATEAAGQALQDAKFEQAAKELEKLEDAEFDKKEALTLEEKLKQVAKEMGDAGLGQMGESATMLAEGIKGGNRSKIQAGGKGLAGAARKQARRRRISRMLEAELENLAECKNPKNGGPKGLAKNKSKTPSTNWGRATAGNIDGEKTNLLSKRNIKEITGNPGDDGPSEMETTHSPEGREQAARKYREAYNKAMKQTEAVLDGEPIPLGHRQTIRKYFESIRPQNEDGSEKAKAEAAKGEK